MRNFVFVLFRLRAGYPDDVHELQRLGGKVQHYLPVQVRTNFLFVNLLELLHCLRGGAGQGQVCDTGSLP